MCAARAWDGGLDQHAQHARAPRYRRKFERGTGGSAQANVVYQNTQRECASSKKKIFCSLNIFVIIIAIAYSYMNTRFQQQQQAGIQLDFCAQNCVPYILNGTRPRSLPACPHRPHHCQSGPTRTKLRARIETSPNRSETAHRYQ